MTPKEVIDEIADELGWNTDTKLALVLQFIEEAGEELTENFREFLRNVKDMEAGPDSDD